MALPPATGLNSPVKGRDRDYTSLGPEISQQMHDFLIHQYDALRQEILKQMEIEHQLVYLLLTIFAIVLGFKFTEVSALPLLSYPAVALSLSLSWSYSDSRAKELGDFIKDHIEQYYTKLIGEVKIGLIGWESHLRRENPTPYRGYRLSIVLVFLLTELSAIGVAIALPSKPPLLTSRGGIIFLVLAIVSFILTCVVLRAYFEEFKESFKELREKLRERCKEFW